MNAIDQQAGNQSTEFQNKLIAIQFAMFIKKWHFFVYFPFDLTCVCVHLIILIPRF